MDTELNAPNPIEQEAELTITCKSCGSIATADDTFCEKCGYPIKGTIEEQSTFSNNRSYRELELSDMNKKIRSASNTMYVLAAIFTVVGVIIYLTTDEAQNPLPLLIANLVLAGLYVALAVWSKKQPVAAIVSALVLYIILQVLAAVEDPSTIYRGIILKIVIVVYLIKGLRSASDAQQIKKELNIQ